MVTNEGKQDSKNFAYLKESMCVCVTNEFEYAWIGYVLILTKLSKTRFFFVLSRISMSLLVNQEFRYNFYKQLYEGRTATYTDEVGSAPLTIATEDPEVSHSWRIIHAMVDSIEEFFARISCHTNRWIITMYLWSN